MSTFFRRAWVLPRSLCLVGLLGGACTRGYEPVSEAEVSGLIAEPAPHAHASEPVAPVGVSACRASRARSPGDAACARHGG